MKLLNKGGETVITFDGRDITIPVGEFEVENSVGNYILRKVVAFGLNVISVDLGEKVEKIEINTTEYEGQFVPKETTTGVENLPEENEVIKEMDKEEPKKVIKTKIKRAYKKK